MLVPLGVVSLDLNFVMAEIETTLVELVGTSDSELQV